MDLDPPQNSRQQRQQQAREAAERQKQQDADTRKAVRAQVEADKQSERRRSSAVSAQSAVSDVDDAAAEDTTTAAAGTTAAAADGFKTKPTALRPVSSATNRANAPTQPTTRASRTAAHDDDTPAAAADKENPPPPPAVKPQRQSVSKVAVDQPPSITVLLTSKAKDQLPNAEELVKQLGGVPVLDCKGSTVTHCIVEDWYTSEKVSRCAV